jgi:hypothetical protein
LDSEHHIANVQDVTILQWLNSLQTPTIEQAVPLVVPQSRWSNLSPAITISACFPETVALAMHTELSG